MAHLPQIITDLAMILLVAGITTIIFKKYNQPLVLGYIIAGFITGPNFSLFPTVTDLANINTWSEIGVIFLLFALGLEFSFYKLKSVGPSAGIAALLKMTGLLAAGYFCGQLLGWNKTDSVFLGCMLSMSSTMIIIKAFDDLKLKGQSFTEIVFGILVIEDIAGIVMLVIISTFGAASADFSFMTIVESIMRLMFFLILWFVMGMYLVPSFFKKAQKFMNDETLLVSSTGLCLGMVVLASGMGFSSALGAFMMGSLIAEAPNAEKIEELVKPVKDLFGAVFFVSVGMLVDPLLLWEYAAPVLFIFFCNIMAKLFFATGGVLSSGQKLQTSLLCGFSLIPLGEFSFIIASLGISLNLISAPLYPIIVAVSVLTTVTAPAFIKAAVPANMWLEQHLPEKLLQKLKRYSEHADSNGDDDWKLFLQNYFVRLIIFLTFIFAIALCSSYYLLPLLKENLPAVYTELVGAAITLLIMAPFLRALLENRSARPELFTILWLKSRANHLPLLALVLFKIAAAALSVFFVFAHLAHFNNLAAAALTAAAVYFIYASDWLMGEYLKMESRFLVNLNEKHMLKHRQQLQAADKNYTFGWFDEELFVIDYKVQPHSSLAGIKLRSLPLRKRYGCNILQISAEGKEISLPDGGCQLALNSSILLIGSKQQLDAVAAGESSLGISPVGERRTLRNFLLKQPDKRSEFFSCAITIDKNSPLLGKSLKETNVRKRWQCLVIGLERGGYTQTNPEVSMIFENGDLLWVLGKQAMINILVKEEVL